MHTVTNIVTSCIYKVICRMRYGPPPNMIVVPVHRELKTGMLRAIIRQAGLSLEEFVELLE